MVSQFPIDPMHLLDQGVGKIILNALLKRQIRRGPRSGDDILALNEVFSAYHRFTPSEFARKSRSLDEAPRFKATEVRQFLLYTGVVLIKEFLTPDAICHFLKLSFL